jgi:putative Holliday junction resolvase
LRILAVDYGAARTGLAFSDLTGSIAGETMVIAETDPEICAGKIAAEAAKRGVKTIIVGLPRNMDGSEGFASERAKRAADLLQSAGDFDVKLWDERLTTVSAHKILSETGKHGKKRKAVIDAVAATLILEGYLASINN